MDINRDNYEEYFLLYADNELTDSEKVAVIMFLKENKDLEKEFRMIHHTISKPEQNIILHDKSFLLKNNFVSLINDTNYEEVFVLYHDNELTDVERNEVEEFLSTHAALQNDFELIGIARLTPEKEMIYPKKQQLYKKEKPGKVVPLFFWRMLAAAVFIGFVLWITTFFYQKNQLPSSYSSMHAFPEKKVGLSPDKTYKPSKDSLNNSRSLTENSQKKNEVEKLVEGMKKPSRKKLENAVVANPVVKKQAIRETGNAVETSKSNDELTADNISKDNLVPEKEIASISKIEPEIQATQNISDKNLRRIEPAMHAQTVSYIQDEKENSQNYVFYNVTAEEFKKTKVGGFLKRVKRVIERTNPVGRLLSGEDRQVVSN